MTDSGDGLSRKLGLFPVTSIVIANMIGAGIFTTSGLLMADLQNALLMILLWIVAGIIALCGALCYGEVGAAIPEAGGEYVFLSRLFSPVLGFLSGWLSFFAGFSAPIAFSAIGCIEYLTRAFPGLLSLGLIDGEVEALVVKKGLAILVIILFSLIHTRGIVFGTRIQNVLTVMKVGLIIGLVLFGLAAGSGESGSLSTSVSSAHFPGWKVIGLSLMWIMFAYSGWNAAAYIGSEIKDPGTNLPRSLLIGTALVVVLYVAINLFYVVSIPAGEMEGVISVAGLAAGRAFGPAFETVISLLIFFALFSSLSAFIILGPRVYFSMARDRCFFSFAARIHPIYKVPHWSILLQGAIAAVMVVLGTFEQVLTYMGFSLGIFPILVVFGVFKLRRSGGSSFRMPGYPIVPLVYIVASTSILILAFLERPVVSSIALFVTALGVPVFYLFKRRRQDA
ncbi:MAG: amino acid permease [Acidobacteriota bacterium]|nr:MAG: amino acid permease [Acidobacteriota bacterium]